MNRIAILPTPGDPYICMLWMRMFDNVKDEINELYVSINSSIDKRIAEFLIKEFEAMGKTKVWYVDHLTQHGTEMAHLTKHASDDSVIVFMEDDGYVLKKGVVDAYFKKIESGEYDVIGSPRTSSSMDLQRVGSRKFNVDLSKAGDVGIGLWPNFLFVKTSDLLKTDMDFNAHCWKKGEYIKEMDWTVQPDEGEDIRADTFVWGSIQLRALKLKILEVPQYHVHPFWEAEKREAVNVFSPDCPWLHVGSLSGSIYGILTDGRGVPLAYKESNYSVPAGDWKLPMFANTPMEKLEHQKRVAFQLMAYRLFNRPEISWFGDQYLAAVNRVIEQGNLDRGDIEAQINTYREVMGI